MRRRVPVKVIYHSTIYCNTGRENTVIKICGEDYDDDDGDDVAEQFEGRMSTRVENGNKVALFRLFCASTLLELS